MNELNIKYSDWKHNILNTQELTAKERWYPTAHITKDFLPHIMPILAAIPLVRNDTGKISPKLTYEALAGTTVKTINGNISGDEVRDLLWCLAKIPRGKFMPRLVQSRDSTYASYTPLALYAAKLHNGVKYSEWEQKSKDRYLALFIGIPLFEAFASLKQAGGNIEVDVLKAKELRKKSLTNIGGVKAGQTEAATSTKCNLKTLPTRVNGNIEEVAYEKPVIMMTLQTWLANANCRNTDSMILDLNDWDNIPKAIDSTIPRAKSQPIIEPKKDEFSIDDL